MTKEEVIKQLKELQIEEPAEYLGQVGADILCDFLMTLGYQDIVDEYNKIWK
jgi:hypothetical protein